MPLFSRGDVIGEDHRYTVRKKVGEGQFSEVYEVEDAIDGKLYALKIERTPDVKTIRQEHKTLRKLQGCSQICRARGSGTHGGRFYMVLDLLGQNLVEVRRGAYGGRMDLPTAKLVALNLLVPLEQMHKEGLIHRDVKPANFAIYPPGASGTEGEWTLIDFGLARRYLDDEQQQLPERTDASFRGSSTYASAQVMEHQDQSRRDDLWSWLYILVELLAGTLPWRREGEGGEKLSREAILQLKRSCMDNPQQLLGAAVPCPKAIVELSKYLSTLRFTDTPSYPWIRELLGRLDEDAPEAALPPYPPAELAGADMELENGNLAAPPSQPDTQVDYGSGDWGPAAAAAGWESGGVPPLPPSPPPLPPGGQSGLAEAMAVDGDSREVGGREPDGVAAAAGETGRSLQPRKQQAGRGDGDGQAGQQQQQQHRRSAGERPPSGAGAAAPPQADGEQPAAAAREGRRGQQQEREREREWEKDRGEKDRDRERERGERDRDRDRERDREREREKERERDGGKKPPRRPGSATGAERASVERSSGGGGNSSAGGAAAAADVTSGKRQGAAAAAGNDGRKGSGSRDAAGGGADRSRRADRGTSSKGGGSGRARSRSRERAGRGRSRSRDRRRRSYSRSRSRDRRSRSRDRRSRSRDRRSRSRDRRSRSRDRRRRASPSRSRSPRSRSPAGWSRRSRSRSRDKDRSRDRSRSRSRERRSRSRDRVRHRSRSRDRAPAKAQQQQQQQPAAAAAAAAAAAQPAAQQPASRVEAQPVVRLSEDQHKRYRETLDYVFGMRMGGLSEEASKALRLLRSLPPGEFLGVVCCLLDDLGGEPSAKQAPVVASCCEDVSAFAAGVAKRCWDRASAAQGDK